MSRHVAIHFASPSCALVSGLGTRQMLTDLIGRPPVWAVRDRAWVVQPHRARDLLAALEHSGGWVVTVTGPPTPAAATAGPAELAEESALW